jgi:hypothetical protein
MSRHRYSSRSSCIIAVDQNYIPMLTVSRRHALKAMATGQAQVLDVSTWSRKGLADVAGQPFRVIVFNKARTVPEMRLGFGHGNAGILRRDDYVCQYCGGFGNTIDHVRPRAQGGKTSWSNCVAACRPCNHKKADRTPEQAQMKLIAPIRSPRYHLFEQFRKIIEAAGEVA